MSSVCKGRLFPTARGRSGGVPSVPERFDCRWGEGGGKGSRRTREEEEGGEDRLKCNAITLSQPESWLVAMTQDTLSKAQLSGGGNFPPKDSDLPWKVILVIC